MQRVAERIGIADGADPARPTFNGRSQSAPTRASASRARGSFRARATAYRDSFDDEHSAHRRARRRPLRAGCRRRMKILFVLEHSGVVAAGARARAAARPRTLDHLAARRVKPAHSPRELQNLADECERIEYALLPSGLRTPSRARPATCGSASTTCATSSPATGTRRSCASACSAPMRSPARAQRRRPPAPGALGRLLRARRARLPPPARRALLARSGPTSCWSRRSSTSARARPTGCAPQAARHPHRVPGLQLGQPDEQGPGSRRARPDARLERPPGAGGGELHGIRRSGSGSRARPSDDPWFDWQPSRTREEFCARGRARPDAADRALPVLVGVRRRRTRSNSSARWIERLAPRRAARRGRLPVRPYPDTARSWVGAGLDGAAGPRLAALRRDAARRHDAAELLRLDLPRGRGRRDQHDRADRERDRRPAGAHAAR